MADPHIKPEMDGLDYLMVVLYRLGMVISGLGLLLLAADVLGVYAFHHYPLWLLALGGVLQASSLHIYDKLIRWFLANATWVGLLVIVIDGGNGSWLQIFGLGCLFVTLSGLAFKESFCFRIPGLKLVPLALALSWFALIVDLPVYAGSLLFPAAGLYCFLALRKARMPLHFDIGDKAAYKI